MSPLAIGLISTGCIFGGALLGLWFQTVMPGHHLRDSSKDAVKLAAGVIATVAALVLGLLISSAKSSFDTVNAELTQAGAKIILLDRTLTQYGPETKAAREQMRRSLAVTIEMVWPAVKTGVSGLTALERADGMEVVQIKLRELAPQSDSQRQLLSLALQLAGDVAQMRWLLIEQEQSSLPTPFLVVLLFWLTMLHVSFGLFADRNVTVISVMFVSALSVSAAIFLILQMNRPLEGLLQVSNAPLRKALEHLGQ
jgi:hypothetical protein